MTDVLVEMLRNNFDFKNPEHIAVYENSGKVEIDLSNEVEIMNASRNLRESTIVKFNNHGAIEGIARKIFEVEFQYCIRGGIGPAIFFTPDRLDLYSQNYAGHYIQVHLPNTYPLITISIGDKDPSALFELQREKYLEFVKKVQGAFLAHYLLKEVFR